MLHRLLVLVFLPLAVACTSLTGQSSQDLKQCLASCTTEHGTCDADCSAQAQSICQNDCPTLADNCRTLHCGPFDLGSPEAADCTQACNGIESSCLGACGNSNCWNDCATVLDNCVTLSCGQFTVGSAEQAQCVTSCADASASCTGACKPDPTCGMSCTSDLGICQDNCNNAG